VPTMQAWMKCVLSAVVAVLALLGAAIAAAAELPDTIQKVKASIVGVGTLMPSRSPAFEVRGTGFVIGDGNLVATNAHVVSMTVDAERREVIAIAIPGEGGSATGRAARIIARSNEADVAILRFEGPPLPAMTLGSISTVREGHTLYFTGFPIGAALGMVPATHRSLVAALAPLALPQRNASQLDPKTVRRLANGVVRVIQLDGTAYPGNSGSPLYDGETGVVVGILNAVFVKASRETALTSPSGITYAVPVEFLLDLLK
jgi:serine protease Do